MHPKPVLADTLQAIIIVGGYTDAPGYEIVPDGHGGFKIVPIPGNDPGYYRDLRASLGTLAAAAQLSESSAGRAILNESARLASAQLSKLGSNGASQTVVVLASA